MEYKLLLIKSYEKESAIGTMDVTFANEDVAKKVAKEEINRIRNEEHIDGKLYEMASKTNNYVLTVGNEEAFAVLIAVLPTPVVDACVQALNDGLKLCPENDEEMKHTIQEMVFKSVVEAMLSGLDLSIKKRIATEVI